MHYSRCRALIFPGEEDLGLTPLEANASGRPVIAYRAGGALDTVVEGATGVFFDAQTPESLIAAVSACERGAWDQQTLRQHAERFSEEVFRRRLLDVIRAAMARSGTNFDDQGTVGDGEAQGGHLLRLPDRLDRLEGREQTKLAG